MQEGEERENTKYAKLKINLTASFIKISYILLNILNCFGHNKSKTRIVIVVTSHDSVIGLAVGGNGRMVEECKLIHVYYFIFSTF